MIALLFAVVRWALLFALGLLLGAQAMALLDPAKPAAQLPLVSPLSGTPIHANGRVPADFPLCVTIKPPPLLRSPDSAHDFRLGRPFNDKGSA